MSATRVATFLLGVWIGCGVCMDLLALLSPRLAGRAINSASPVAADLIRKSGQEQIALLRRDKSRKRSRLVEEDLGASSAVRMRGPF